MSKVQAVLFENDKWNVSKARAWLKKNNYRPIKRVHKTANFLRYRIREPSIKKQYRTITFGKKLEGIRAILEY
jgi:hypothetical protein